MLTPQWPITKLPIKELNEYIATKRPYPPEPAFKILFEKTGQPIDIGPFPNKIKIPDQVKIKISKAESFFNKETPFLISEKKLNRDIFFKGFSKEYFISKNKRPAPIVIKADNINRFIIPKDSIKKPPEKKIIRFGVV